MYSGNQPPVIASKEFFMDRRDFLKVTGLATSSLFLVSSPFKSALKFPVQTATGGKIYRGTAEGDVEVSEDGGKTWKLHARFGPDCPILDIYADRHGQVALQAGYKAHSFRLFLAKNGRDWLVGANSAI
jgi:hypothetical protein